MRSMVGRATQRGIARSGREELPAGPGRLLSQGRFSYAPSHFVLSALLYLKKRNVDAPNNPSIHPRILVKTHSSQGGCWCRRIWTDQRICRGSFRRRTGDRQSSAEGIRRTGLGPCPAAQAAQSTSVAQAKRPAGGPFDRIGLWAGASRSRPLDAATTG